VRLAADGRTFFDNERHAMTNTDSRVTIHMAASLDGFIARMDGRVDWIETSDQFVGGNKVSPESIDAFLNTIDCYVMGSRTYETAIDFEAKGLGWAYGDKPHTHNLRSVFQK
jgi:dihydrofolate reductase